MKKWFCGIFAAVLTLLLAVPAYAALPDGVGMITNCSHISGKEFSSKTSIAKKLDKMFAGDIGLYKDAKKTTLVDAALGTSNVPNNNVYQYWGPTPRAGTSCFAYANAFYGHFYDGVYPHHSLNSNHKVIKATGKITYKNFVKWGVRDDAAVYIREGNHSIIVLHYNEDYITYVDGNGNGKGLIAIRKEAWKRSKGANIYDQKPSLIVQPTTSYFAAGSMNSEKGKSCLEGGESHDWDEGEITKTASCKETGLRVYTCLDCGKTKEETLKKTSDHSYGEWTVSKEPTCTAKGKNVAVCSVCGGEKTKTVKALGHKYGKTTVVQEGTIWSPGITEKTCKTCGKVAKTKSDCIVESVEFGITFTTKEKVFPKKTTLTVVQPDDPDGVMTALQSITGKAMLFEPETVVAEERVQPKGSVRLEIKIPQDFSANVALYQFSDGEVTALESIADPESGIVSADVESFGVFALCDLDVPWVPEPTVEVTEPVTEPTEAPTTQPETQPETTQPQARAAASTINRELLICGAAAAALLIALISLVIVFIVRQHKKKKLSETQAPTEVP